MANDVGGGGVLNSKFLGLSKGLRGRQRDLLTGLIPTQAGVLGTGLLWISVIYDLYWMKALNEDVMSTCNRHPCWPLVALISWASFMTLTFLQLLRRSRWSGPVFLWFGVKVRWILGFYSETSFNQTVLRAVSRESLARYDSLTGIPTVKKMLGLFAKRSAEPTEYSLFNKGFRACGYDFAKKVTWQPGSWILMFQNMIFFNQ